MSPSDFIRGLVYRLSYSKYFTSTVSFPYWQWSGSMSMNDFVVHRFRVRLAFFSD